jgi:hypothetical protein
MAPALPGKGSAQKVAHVKRRLFRIATPWLEAGIDGSLRPANQFAVVPNPTHYTLAVEPMLPEIVERFLGKQKAVGRGEARNYLTPKTTSQGGLHHSRSRGGARTRPDS